MKRIVNFLNDLGFVFLEMYKMTNIDVYLGLGFKCYEISCKINDKYNLNIWPN